MTSTSITAPPGAGGGQRFRLGLPVEQVRQALDGDIGWHRIDPEPCEWGYTVIDAETGCSARVGVRIQGDQVRLGREGFGEVVLFSLGATYLGMAPVRLAAVREPQACLGGRRHEDVAVCSPDWLTGADSLHSPGPAWVQRFATRLDACVWVARALIV